jgi:hypothetical protein
LKKLKLACIPSDGVPGTTQTPTEDSDEAMAYNRNNLLLGLPGELRNEIYRLVMDLREEHTPVLELRKEYMTDHEEVAMQKKNNFNLLLVSRGINFEAGSLMATETQVYLPLCSDAKYLPLHGAKEESTALRVIKNFMNIEFHIEYVTERQKKEFMEIEDIETHRRTLYACFKAESRRVIVNNTLSILQVYMEASQAVSKSNRWKRRHTIIHLDHMLCYFEYEAGVLQQMVDVISWDVNTEWEIRFYVFTRRGGYEQYWQADLAFLDALCRNHEHISVKAELYGPEEWESGVEDDLRPRGARVPSPRTYPPSNGAVSWIRNSIIG